VVPAEAGGDQRSGVTPDVLVVGGGPSGCAASTLLARWGHRVTLLTKSATELPPLGESIPPSTRKLFDVLGVRDRLDAAGFVRSTGNTVWWGRSTPRIEYFDSGQRGWQVTTTGLEQVLREAATDAGVTLQTARVDPDARIVQEAAFVLDCSGRAGVFARARHLREPEPRLRTVALVGSWSADTFDLPEPSHTVIESYDGGWAWSVPSSASQRYVAVMVDPRTSTLVRDSLSREVYLAELAKTQHLQRMLCDATLVDGPRGWDASMYHARHYVDGHVLLAGDAGSFIDPLSSAGVKKAIASGWLAAVATHTALRTPDMRAVALDFFDAREREVYARFRGTTEQFLGEAAAGHAHPFWTDRALDADLSAASERVAAAFEQVRTARALRVNGNPEAHVDHRPAVSGTEIVLERRLVRDDRPEGARFAYDVDLLTLVELAPSFTSVPDLFDAYNRRAAPVALPDFLGALATAIADRWLVWCDTY
jgi:2-polyprenyl-6-methoxyphenol hydroxylase-like FAD-dependent oxidoreductase